MCRAPGDEFHLFDFAAAPSGGGFDAIALPTLATGLAWETTQLLTAGTLAVVTDLPGDFDFDADVDGAAFLLWQRGESPQGPGAADLAVWQSHFGATLPPPAATTAVTEPPTLLLACLALLAAAARGARCSNLAANATNGLRDN